MSVGERNDIEGARQLAIRCANEKPLGPVFPPAVPTPFHRILYPKKLYPNNCDAGITRKISIESRNICFSWVLWINSIDFSIQEVERMSTPHLAPSTPFSISWPARTSYSWNKLVFASIMSEAGETRATRIEFESVSRPVEHVNAFLKSGDISPIRNTLRTPWDEASDWTRRHTARKKS